MEVSLEKIQQFFLTTEQGRALQAEEQRQAQRRTLVDQIATLREREATELPELRKRAQEATAALEIAARAFAAVRESVQAAAAEAAIRQLELSDTITRCQSKLRAAADPRIQAFIQKCWECKEQTRNKFWVTQRQGAYNFVSGQYQAIEEGNGAEINAVLAAIDRQAKGAEALQLLALPPKRLRPVWPSWSGASLTSQRSPGFFRRGHH